MLLIVALHLQDALLALQPHEAVLERTARGRWQARFGLPHWKLWGREVVLPALLAPHRVLFRLRWSLESPMQEAKGVTGPDEAGGRVHVPRGMAWLGVSVWVAWLCLFVLLPLGLFDVVGGRLLCLVALVGLYLNNLLALVLVYRWRARWGVPARAVATLAVECLACPPYAVNLVRRLCALAAPREDFLQAARRLLAPADLALAQAQCLRRVEEAIEAEPLGSARMAALEAARRQLQPAPQPEAS